MSLSSFERRYSGNGERLCRYCGEPPERHQGRCSEARFLQGEVRRCLRGKNHSSLCVYRKNHALLDRGRGVA